MSDNATIALTREEGAALVASCLTILYDLVAPGVRYDGAGGVAGKMIVQPFPDAARPLFRAYLKLCAISNHDAHVGLLQAAFETWGENT